MVNPDILARRNLLEILVQCAPAVIVGCGLTLVVVSGEIDISIGSLIGLLAAVMGILAAVAGHRWWGHRRGPTSAIVADIMRSATVDLRPGGPAAVSPELSLWECAARLAHAGVRELPVVQEGRLIGIVGDTDIVRALEERGGGD